jgi:hypothetical protein
LRAPVAGATIRHRAELGDRNRLPLRDESAPAVSETVGDCGGAVQIDGHDVEGRLGDSLERHGGRGESAAEAFAYERHGPAKKVVDTGTDLDGVFTPSIWLVEQRSDPLVDGATEQESVVHQAQLSDGDEHDRGPFHSRGIAGRSLLSLLPLEGVVIVVIAHPYPTLLHATVALR